MDAESIKQKLKVFVPVVVVSLLAGIGIGWAAKPDVVKIEEKERVVEKQVTTEAIQQLMASFESLKVELQKVRETQVVQKYHQETTETKHPDGTYTKVTTIDKNIDSHTKETETKTEVKVVQVEKKVETIKTEYVDKIVTKDRIVTPELAQWHVGVLGGISPQFLPTPGVQSWVVGGEVERRIVGPVFLGIWGAGTTTGQGMGGVKVGFEF